MSTRTTPDIDELLKRITSNPEIYGGEPIIRGRRYAVEHVLMQLALGDTPELLMEGHPWLERDDILACIAYAYRERRVPVTLDTDFGELAVRRQIQHCDIIRAAMTPVHLEAQVCLAALSACSDELAAGAIVTATPRRIRLRPPDEPV